MISTLHHRFACRLGACLTLAAASAATVPAKAVGELSPQALQQAAEYSSARRGHSLLVIQNDKTVLEKYSNGANSRTSTQIYSGTKSFWTVATLAAAQDGLLEIDGKVADTIHEWRSDPRRKSITIRDLLTFTSGLDPAFPLHSDRVTDRNRTALSTRIVAPRGTAFTYGPSHGQVLCEVLRRRLLARGETPIGYLRRKVLDPLGIGPVPYRNDKAGNPLVASGIKLTARQWAKFGTMLLGNGKSGGRVVVPAAMFDQALHGTRTNPSFGFGLWLNTAARSTRAREVDIEKMLELPWQKQSWHNTCLCRSAPPDLIAAVGSGYNRLFVIPSRNLVVVRQGADAHFSDARFLSLLLGKS